MTNPLDLTQVSWNCIHFSADPDVSATPSVLKDRGIYHSEITAQETTNKDQLLRLIAGAMQFPEYFGMNWDALSDCLRDMTWVPAAGYVLTVHQAELLWQKHYRAAGSLVEIWLSAAQFWSDQGKPFHLVFHG